MLGVWREERAHRNRKMKNMSVLFVSQRGNVTLDGGETERGQR